MATAIKEDRWVQSVCKMCLAGCGIVVHVVDGVVVKIEGDPTNPDNMGKLCPKGQSGLMRLYDPNRVKAPLKRTNPQKGPGVDPKWQEISWEEAFQIVGEKLKQIHDEDPRKLLVAINDFQRLALWAWPAAFGSPHYFTTVGQYCGAAYHPINGLVDASFACINDFAYCNYWMQIGSGDGFSSHLHLSGSTKRMADARDRGMKVVFVEPRMSPGAAKADEWVPIRPGTDRAFVLGMCHVLLHELNRYDVEFIKHQTNGPYLIGPDGYFVRDPETKKPLVWDAAAGLARVFDDPELGDFALEGTYRVHGVDCRPAFQVIKDTLKDHTPERMSKICSVPAETIRRLAREFVDAARIGSKIMIEGKEYPYRPAAVNFYRGAISHFDGALDCMALKLINLLVGNIDVPGGHMGVPLDERGLWIEPGPDGMLNPQPHMLHPPYDFTYPANSTQLMEYFPIGVDPGHLNAETILNREKYGLNFEPEAMLIYHSNPLWNIPGTAKVEEVFRRMKFIVAIDVVLNESTEWADIVLPDHTYLESEYLICLEAPEVTGLALRQPVVKPLYNTKDATDILTEISARVGILKNWNEILNFRYSLFKNPQYMLEPDKKYSIQEILDRYARNTYGPDCGLEWFREHGHKVRLMTKEEKYLPYGSLRLPIYFNYIKEVGDDLREKFRRHGVEWDTSAYLPVPVWRDRHPLHNLPAEYDLYAITFKSAILNFAENTTIPWIREVIEREPTHMGILINAETARRKGIRDGDRIEVESPWDKVQGVAKVIQEIHPEVLGFSNGITRWASHPVERRMKSHFNRLLPSTLEFTDLVSGALESAVKVKVRKI